MTSVLPGQAADQFSDVRSAMRRMIDSVHSPSVAVAIAKNGRVVFEDAMGWADPEKRVRATANTMYALASVTKPLTATGVMVLAERGKIDLDAPINTYLRAAKITGLAAPVTGVTARRILSHTAGLPLHSQFFYADQPDTARSLEETIAHYGNVVFPPGRLEEYSNLGYAILGYLIEQVSGQSYAEFMRREVFEPLGLQHTSVGTGGYPDSIIAAKYGSDGRRVPAYTLDVPGAGGGYASAHDLIRFAMYHLKNKLPEQRPILKPSTIDEMHRPVPPGRDGLGFGVFDEGRHVAHTGGMPGATTLLAIVPEQNAAVVVLANTTTRPAAMAEEFAIGGLALSAASPGRIDRLGPPSGSAVQSAFRPTPQLVGDWSGTLRTYERPVAMLLHVGSEGRAYLTIGDQPRVEVTNLVFEGERLSGNADARMPTRDAQRWPHRLSLSLLLDNGKLAGEVTANSAADRTYFTLSSYAELRKNPRVEVVAAGLVTPWAMALAPDGRLFVTERPGRIRVVVHDSLLPEPWASVNALSAPERGWETGLMGLALNPDFSRNPFVYVCYSASGADVPTVNRVVRLRERNGKGQDPMVLIDSIPAGPFHDGCRLKIGPDAKLYVTTGDAYKNSPAQDPASLAGKVLRINLDGTIPDDNPSPKSPVWSFGHRNPQGLAWDPRTRLGFLTEHGTSGIDEINLLMKNANYGWPAVQGQAHAPGYRDPVLVIHAAPAGATFILDSASAGGSVLIVAALSGERLVRLLVRGEQVSVADDSALVGYGRLRDVIAGTNGSIYVSTSNRDGRGRPRAEDDRILRVWLPRTP